MKRIQNIFLKVLLDVKNLTRFESAVNDNCETQKDKKELKEFIKDLSLNSVCCECIAKTINLKSYGFENVSDLQSFIYVHMWNNPVINNL